MMHRLVLDADVHMDVEMIMAGHQPYAIPVELEVHADDGKVHRFPNCSFDYSELLAIVTEWGAMYDLWKEERRRDRR